MRHEDLALAQHVSAFQTSSLIGVDYGGISDQDNMVVVVAKNYVEEKHGGASEPTGSHRPAAELTGGAKEAAQSPADTLEDQPKRTDRRKARDGYLYTKEEFLAHYGEDGHDRREEADQADEHVWGTTDVNSILGRALWPRETPKMMVDGDILLAVATCPPAAVIEDLFTMLLRVRQAEFEADACDTDAAEPGDSHRSRPSARWHRIRLGICSMASQQVDRITLYPWQEGPRQKLPRAAFARKLRSWFEAGLNWFQGNRHVARAVIGFGTSDPAIIANILEAIQKEKEEEVKKRKLQDESHGAGAPVGKLKLDAHIARKALRDGERLAKKLDSGNIQLDWIHHQQKELLEEFHARRLHVRVDRAYVACGHGIARTHDFGFRPGDNMCRDVPIEVEQWCCRAYCRLSPPSRGLLSN